MIKKLSDVVISQIAAGEVVERPASVIKELIENSLDANATEITIKIKKGGLEEISVLDNGDGISKSDLPKAFLQHTTSKINSINDLDSIFSFGFRGEALASISAVSKVVAISKTKNDPAYKIEITGGKQSEIIQFSRNIGTTITISDIFYNLPARKKFLKTEKTEYNHIIKTFMFFAISNPNVRFFLFHNGKNVYNFSKVNSLKERIYDIYGSNISDNLLNISEDTDMLSISGLISNGSLTKGNSSMQYIFVNGRYVKDKLIAKAIKDAYLGVIAYDRYPVYFIFLRMNTKLVDVNVHPRKLEVRFNNTNNIYSFVRKTVDKQLNNTLKDNIINKVNDSVSYNSYNSNNLSLNDRYSKKIKNLNTKYSNSQIKSIKSFKNSISNAQALDFTKKIVNDNSSNNIIDDTPLKNNQSNITHQTSIDIELNYPIYQFFNSYICIEYPDKLLFIDQHAAYERINYEKILNQMENKVISRPLLLPVIIELQKDEYQIVMNNINNFMKLGFDIVKFGNNEISVNSVPEILKNPDVKILVEKIIDNFKDEFNNIESNLEYKIDKCISTIACHRSVTANQNLSVVEIKKMLKELLSCTKPNSCPHGRPIMFEMSRTELEKKFNR